MWMTSDDAQKYPDLKGYLLYGLPQVPQRSPRVFWAFLKYSGFSLLGDLWGFGASRPLMWGFGPSLAVNADASKGGMMECIDDGEEKIGDNRYVERKSLHWYGFTVPNRSANKIIIAADLATLGGTPDEIVLEATVLHELVHWSRLQAGYDNYDREDEPRAFEREAYGRVVLRTWETCFSPEYYKVK
jgi:hypothetical protein